MNKWTLIISGILAASMLATADMAAKVTKAAKQNKQKYLETTEKIKLREDGKAECSQSITKPDLEKNDVITGALDKLVEDVTKSSGCVSASEYAEEGDSFDSSLYFKIKYRDNKNVFATVLETSDSYLGRAHPNSSSTPHILDLKQNKEISSDTLFNATLLTEAKKFISETYAIKAVMQNNKHIERTKNKLTREKNPTKVADYQAEVEFAEDCNGLYKENSDYFSLSPAKSGFVVNISLPHVAAACDRVVYISYQEISTKNPEFFNKNSVISHLIIK
jgi:hypothetical protein